MKLKFAMVIWSGVVLGAIGILFIFLTSQNQSVPAAAPVFSPLSVLPTPNAVERAENWSFYQLWFLGKRDTSVREYVRLLKLESLPYGRDAWIEWVGHDPRMRMVLLTQLRPLTVDARIEVRVRVGYVLSRLARVAIPLRDSIAVLLGRMLCDEKVPDLQKRLLQAITFPSDLNPVAVQMIEQCVMFESISGYQVNQLFRIENLSLETTDLLCRSWLADERPFKLADTYMAAHCLTQAEAVRSVELFLTHSLTVEMSGFDVFAKALAATDIKFHGAIADTLLTYLPTVPDIFEGRIIHLLVQLQIDPLQVDKIVEWALSVPDLPQIDELLYIRPSDPVRTDFMERLLLIVEDPVQSMQLRSYALAWYTQLALTLDVTDRQQALQINLALWRQSCLPPQFHSAAIASMNQLILTLGPEASRQGVAVAMELLYDECSTSYTGRKLIENFPDLLVKADVETVYSVVDELLRLAALGNIPVRNDLVTVLARLVPTVDIERQAAIVHILIQAFHEELHWYDAKGANCGLHNSALQGLIAVADYPALDPTVRQGVIATLVSALAEFPSPENCLTHFSAARGLENVVHFLSLEDNLALAAYLRGWMSNPLFVRESGTVVVVLARLEAAQILDHQQPIEPLVERLLNAPGESEQRSYSAALFVVALCDPYLRPSILAMLLNARETAPYSQALLLGQVITMIEALTYTTGQPLELESREVISFIFKSAYEAGGDGYYHRDFCRLVAE